MKARREILQGINSNGRFGVLGTTGSGKSNSTYILLLELIGKGHPIAILDHKGEYGTLPGCVKMKASQTQASSLPLRLRNSDVSVIVDLRGSNKEAWVRDFVTGCLRLPRRKPILIVIEEAHNYCPQKGKAGGCKQAVNNLAAEGRSNGYGLVLISQRCSKLDKDALTQCDALYIHYHGFKTDLDYLEGFIGKDRRQIVENLGVGDVLHLDMKGGHVYTKFHMPEAEKKSVGGTPQPVQAKPNYVSFYGPLPGQYPRGGGGSQYDYKSGPALVIIVIIVILITVALSYFAIKGMDSVDAEEKAIDDFTSGGFPQ